MNEDCDLIIIGGGSAGLTAAAFAVQLGERVALVEKHHMGGDCTWFGCVPSKTLLKSAKVAHHMRMANRYGLTSVEPQVDIKSVMAHVRSVIDEVYEHETPQALREEGIDVIEGAGHFIDSHTMAVGDRLMTARKFLVCTGPRPFVPPIPGLDEVAYLTYETLWDIQKMPQRLLILGGGPIGCEMAQAFGRLGSEVTIVEGAPRLLPHDDLAASDVIRDVFQDEGIEMRLGVMAQRVWQDNEGIHLMAGAEKLVGDALLVAVGRAPHIAGLDLQKAGVNYTPKGIAVNDHLQSTQKHIYAAGDCVGGYQFTHYAGWQAFMAVRNALLPGSTKGVSDSIPWATFTDPEVAHVGLTESQAREKFGDGVSICHWPMDRVDRARTEGDTSGFLQVVHKKDGEILGVTIVAGRASEVIHEWIIALEHGLKISDIAETIHIYPTYATASMQAGAEIRISQLLSGTSGKLLKGLVRLMR